MDEILPPLDTKPLEMYLGRAEQSDSQPFARLYDNPRRIAYDHADRRHPRPTPLLILTFTHQ